MSDDKNETKKVQFWGENPNALFNADTILELFPSGEMSYNQKLNAVSRLVILLTLIFYFMFRSLRAFIIGILTLAALWLLHYTQDKPKKKVRFKEGFETDVANSYLKNKMLPTDIFAETTKENPLQNVLMTDYDNADAKKPAPAAYNPTTQREILTHAKQMIDDINPEQPKISEKLFRSLEDNLAFEQSMRPFYSNPATTIPNDQGAFVDFCYGSMVSCKEGNPFACARQLAKG